MVNSTSNTYQMKRKILTFTNKISKRLSKPERKFTADITYGMLAAVSYLQMVKKWAPSEPVIHIDDSDVVKPDGYKFKALGIVRDGSESTSTKMCIKRAIMLRKPVSLPPAIIRSAYFPEYTHPLRRIINQQIPLLLTPWSTDPLFLKKRLFAWIVVTTITRYF